MGATMALRYLLCTLLLSGCASTYVEISAGPQVTPIYGSDSWYGEGPIVDAAIRRYWDNWFCEYRHTSNLGSGWPFNNEYETTLDRVTCGRSFALGGRE